MGTGAWCIVLRDGYANACSPSDRLPMHPCTHGPRPALTGRSRLAVWPICLSKHWDRHRTPLQRSCGTKVRRVAGCRRAFPRTALFLSDALHLVFIVSVLTPCRWSLGSVLFLAAWSVMMGPMQYSKHAAFLLGRRICPRLMHADVAFSSTPHFGSEIAIHGCLLWKHCAHALLLSRRKLSSLFSTPPMPHPDPCKPLALSLRDPCTPLRHTPRNTCRSSHFTDTVRVISSTAPFLHLLPSLPNSSLCSGSPSRTFPWALLACALGRGSRAAALPPG
jgi:hypothetical protein